MPIIECQKCKKSLQLPDEYVGRLVQCPHCQQTFTAAAPEAFPMSAQVMVPPITAKPDAPSVKEDTPVARPPRRRRYEDDEDEEESVGVRRGSRRYQVPDRGATVLILGILSLVLPCAAPILGPIAWIMGSHDLKEMDAGRMDSSGKDITRVGQVIGIVTSILSMIGIALFCLWFMIAVLAAAHH